MMDARINIGLPSHPKTKKLIRKLGDGGAWRLVVLFLWVAANRPDGELSGMSGEDIELAADFAGEEGAFVSALKSVGFLDGDEGCYRIHDWSEHNPWAAGADARSEKAKWLALCKHHGRDKAAELMPAYAARIGFSAEPVRVDPTPPAESMLANAIDSATPAESMLANAIDSATPATSMRSAENSSAPYPLPSPSPLPTTGSLSEVELTVAETSQPDPAPLNATSRAGALCQHLRKLGIDAAPHMPAWTEILPAFSDEQIIGAATRARDKKPGERIHLAYLLPMLRDALLPKARASPSRASTGRQARIDNYAAEAAAARGEHEHSTGRSSERDITGEAVRIA